MTVNHDDDLKTQIAALLGAGTLKIERLPTSGNNRLYLIDAGKEKFVAKHYFTHAGDKRNRLVAEYSFISFASRNGIDCLPRPVAKDEKNDLAIYSFIDGRRPELPDVTPSTVARALDFLKTLNAYRETAVDDISNASEACFSIDAHLQLVEQRVNRLLAVTDAHAHIFINNELVPSWEKTKATILTEASAKGLRTGENLPPCDRIISPSDFGFHNVLVGNDGKIYFLDFEYAGWDDPAKTVGDFFSHLALPVPAEYLGIFAKRAAGLTSDPDATLLRIGLLLRLYRIKWCCIALNHFIPVDSDRRRFAGNRVSRTKEEQIVKARRLMGSMETLNGAAHGLY
ncbi:MAG: aminoglycoside phosphotransferase family protein [Candidatus Omnitrophota bacterium]